jgi:hypothetical protein
VPTQYQRTSVDIDVVYYGDVWDLEGAIARIQERFEADDTYFTFRPHVPEQPTTTLPLRTYHVSVPTVCTDKELRGKSGQRLKVEFITTDKAPLIHETRGERLFALDTDRVYNVLPLDILFADKLTTLGPRTIGIGNHRKDEQVKQIYDIHSLLVHNLESLDFNVVRNVYLERAAEEARIRRIAFDMKAIIRDAANQLGQLCMLDIDPTGNILVWGDIANFLALYAGREAARTQAQWANVGEQLKLVFRCLFDGNSADKTSLERAFALDKELQFDHLSGAEKGLAIASFTAALIRDFGGSSSIPPKLLKGKHIRRIYWSIVNADNLDKLELFVLRNKAG